MTARSALMGLMSSFAVVVDAGSFTRAAQRLGLSKSVVSRHVSALERALGVQLLYRSTHRLALTEAGERFHAHCRELQQVADQAVAAAAAAREQPQGLLRLTLPQTLVVSPVGRLIAKFQQAYPELRMDVRVTSLQVDPIEEGFDVALRIGALRDSSLAARRIREVRMQAVATPAYLRRCGTPRTPQELAQHNCLIYSEFESRARWPYAGRAPRRAAPALNGNLSTNSAVLLLGALLGGQGIAIGPDLMFEAYLRRRRLRIVLDAYAPEPTGLYAVFPSGRFPSASRKAFVDFLVAGLAAGTAVRRGQAECALG